PAAGPGTGRDGRLAKHIQQRKGALGSDRDAPDPVTPPAPGAGPRWLAVGPGEAAEVMARCGVASRRACETMIAEGRVRVNGRVVREPGTKIDPATDRVEVDGRILTPPEELVYIALHKPRGYVTTVHDPQ